MNAIQRYLIAALITALCACGGSGTTPAPNSAPATTKTSTQKANATATVTLRFPTHVGRAKLLSKTSSKDRSPAYINPSGGSLVVTAYGTTLQDPNNPGNYYFSLGAQDLTTGTSTLTIPLVSGHYNPGDLSVTEYDGSNGCCTPLAYGQNLSYSDVNGNYQDGSFNLSAGGNATPVLTMVMNVAGIAFTTDPSLGSDAVMLSNNGVSPTPFGGCSNPGQYAYYAFAADASGTFVLPGNSTGSGYTGGDSANAYPGIPSVSLTSQSTDGTGGRQAILVPSAVGSYSLRVPNGNYNLEATFQTQNPISATNPPFGYSYYIYGYVDLGNASC